MLTHQKIIGIYKKLRSKINDLIKSGNYSEAWSTIDTFALVAEKVNDIFRDDCIENALRYIGEEQIQKKTVEHIDSNSSKIVFYDQIGTTICLALQYLRALKSLGYEIFYIFERKGFLIDSNLRSEVELICTQTAYYDGEYSIEIAKEIQESIVRFGASKLIAHSPCFGAMGSSVLYSLIGIEKYRIIPGDHHFYIGIDCIDHFIEFRDFGINVSVDRRKIPIEKINRLAYYPIIESNIPFAGFPDIVNGKIVIAAAAREAKFHGSDWFFLTAKCILEKYDDVVILFIGGNSTKVLKFVENNNLQDRFIVLGYRNDFIECMKHIDVFFDSYPWGSALTSMTAAYFSKPIISYHDERFVLESLNSWMARKDGKKVSYSDEGELKKYINQVIKDASFREKEGACNKDALSTPEIFTEELCRILEGKQPVCQYAKLNQNTLDDRCAMYIDSQNTYIQTIINLLYSKYHLQFFFLFPELLIDRLKIFLSSRISKFFVLA